MSAAKMVADSTQSEFADGGDGKKKKKKMKKTGKRVVLPEDEDSDLDLKKELQPIGAFVKDRPAMVQQMFHAVRGASLQRAVPDLLKSIPLDELKQLCLEQLEVMSKKRIRRILAGEESANISSSGTEDDTSDEEAARGDDPAQQPVTTETDVSGHPADSTSLHQERSDPSSLIGGPSGLVEVKQEPPDSADDGDDDDDEDEDDDEEEEAPETYTSGSEDGELVKRTEQGVSYQDVAIKQEPVNDEDSRREEEMEEGGDQEDEQDMEDQEDPEGDLMSSVQAGAGEDGLLPSIMMDQMELLELEMRARAIKAMLSSHDHEGTAGGEEEEEEEEEEEGENGEEQDEDKEGEKGEGEVEDGVMEGEEEGGGGGGGRREEEAKDGNAEGVGGMEVVRVKEEPGSGD